MNEAKHQLMDDLKQLISTHFSDPKEIVLSFKSADETVTLIEAICPLCAINSAMDNAIGNGAVHTVKLSDDEVHQLLDAFELSLLKQFDSDTKN